MIIDIELKLSPEKASDDRVVEALIRKKLSGQKGTVHSFEITKKSIDARGRSPKVVLRVRAYLDEDPPETTTYKSGLQTVSSEKKVIIIGAGPAGYFAALKCIELGMKPIVLDRGKDVQARRRDLKAIQQDHIVNPNSNYCFGEGGAGTYSDGKLYTRSKKRGSIQQVLEILVEHGAMSDILIDAHPHIGSNKLPKVVANIRDTILAYGGEVHFNTKVIDFCIEQDSMKGVITHEDKLIEGQAFILATGHSARDIYTLCRDKEIKLEAKDFSIGVRMEHPQALIDEIQYNQNPRSEHLPASSYGLSCQVDERGVFSFCMCPGGLIVPAATSPEEIVVNGMSLSKRDSPYANAGTVVAIDQKQLSQEGYHGVFAGLEYQQKLEQSFFEFGDGSQRAPAQLLPDFLNNKISSSVIPTSYIPGVYSAPLHEMLPSFIVKSLQEGIQRFGRMMKGYITDQAQLIGLESRTSSPVRIPRNRKTYMHEDVLGLFPCGEGAGYAGGIVSAAVDGQNVAKGVFAFLENHT